MATGVSIYNKVVFCDKNVGGKDDVKLVSELAISKKVGSISEMANSLNNLNNVNNGNFNFVMVCGHAAPGLQGLGSNKSANYVQGKDFDFEKLDDIANEINIIGNSLNTTRAVKPVLFLAGCMAGSGSNGTILIRNLSAKIPNVLVVASENYLTFKQVNFGQHLVSIAVKKVLNKKPSNYPIDFKFAINGHLIRDANIFNETGVDAESLRGELISINNEN